MPSLLCAEDYNKPLHVQQLALFSGHCSIPTSSAINNSRPLDISQPISTFGRPKSILVGQIYCTFSMRQQSITYEMFYFQKNSQPNSDPYFYHCMSVIGSVLPTWIAVTLLFLSLLCSVLLPRPSEFSSLSLTLSIFTWQCNDQYLEKSTILCCKSSIGLTKLLCVINHVMEDLQQITGSQLWFIKSSMPQRSKDY